MSDELHQPLGQGAPGSAPKRAARRRMTPGAIAASAAGALALAAGAYTLKYGDPQGGWPKAVAKIEAYTPPAVAVQRDPAPTGSVAQRAEERQSAQEIERQSGVKVTRAGGAAAPGALIIQLDQPAGVSLAPSPDKRLVENTRAGALPRIGADGARPYEVYARPVVMAQKLKSDAPRIALIVGGLGISATTTDAALDTLPAEVSFAFAPYGGDLPAQTARAREHGHETFLQAPMEPFDYPRNDPGPHTLAARASDHELTGDLRWLMSRFTGYVGVVNFLGARFLSNAAALTPVLRELSQRGVAFVDDGSAPQSVSPAVAANLGAVATRADVVIDGDPRPEAIEAALTRLEAVARTKGAALGVASAIPQSITMVDRFARGLEKRGVALVPASAMLSRGASPQAENRRQ